MLLRRLCVYSHVCHTSGQYPTVAWLPLRTMGVFISSGWSKSLSSFARPDPQHQPASRTASLPVRRGLQGGLCLPVRDYIDKIHKKFPVKFT